MSIDGDNKLSGKRVFVLEDEPLIAIDLEYMLYSAGVGAVDVCLSLSEDVIKIAKRADAAVLDLTIKGVSSIPIVLKLLENNIPTLIITGQSGDAIDPAIDNVPRLSKPFDNSELVDWLTSNAAQTDTSTA